jgi:hypothetical protein
MKLIESLLKEYDIEIDDIRWFLSVQTAEELLSLQQEPRTLIERIWSGRLGDQIYQMEERYITSIEDELSRGVIDEAKVREKMMVIKKAKRNRWVK